MKKREMVKSKEVFNEIINKGKSVNNNYFRIFYMNNTTSYPKFGLAVGKKLGNAVTRNYIKRQLRTIVDKNKFMFSNGLDYIIMVKRAYLNTRYEILNSEFTKLIEKVNQ